MRFSRTTKTLSLAAISALALTACGGGESASSDGDKSYIVNVNGSEPKAKLVATNTGETGGGRIMDLISEGLYTYDEDGKLVDALIDKWETTDNQNYTIKIKADQKFDNGDPLTAKDFVDSWTFGALPKNKQYTGDFFQDIEGVPDAPAKDDPEKDAKEAANLAVSEVSGLKVVDDTTFTVKLKQPINEFQLRMGYTAFRPMHKSILADPETGGENPIGNGPYKMAKEGAWEHDKQISVIPNENYQGPRKAKNGGVNVKIYQAEDAAYTDVLANNLDVLDSVPAAAFKTFKDEFADRHAEKATAVNQSFVIPTYLDHFKQDEEGKLRRQAISMAINRDEIIEKIFNGTRVASTEFSFPSAVGYDGKLDGSEIAKFDAAKAKELWAQAESISPFGDTTFTLAYNADSSHKDYVDAITNMLKNNLGIKAEGKPYPTFPDLRKDVEAGKLTGATRSGWQGDFPSIYNFIQPKFQTGSPSNDGRYSNPEFDAKLKEGLAQKTPEEAAKIFNEAQSIVLKDAAAVPLWYGKAQAVWSEKVDNVKLDWRGVPMYTEITGK